MRDKVSEQRLLTLHPKLRDEAIKLCNEIDAKLTGKAILRVAYTTRTWQEQAELYAEGRTKLFDANGKKLGIVTKAAPGYSLHNYSLALDFVLLVDNDNNGSFESASWDTNKDYDKDGKADWDEVLDIFRANGWSCGADWGGNTPGAFKDKPHVEKTFGHSVKDLLAKYNAKDFIAGTTYVNI